MQAIFIVTSASCYDDKCGRENNQDAGRWKRLHSKTKDVGAVLGRIELGFVGFRKINEELKEGRARREGERKLCWWAVVCLGRSRC